jgi:hypothetical protein
VEKVILRALADIGYIPFGVCQLIVTQDMMIRTGMPTACSDQDNYRG